MQFYKEPRNLTADWTVMFDCLLIIDLSNAVLLLHRLLYRCNAAALLMSTVKITHLTIKTGYKQAKNLPDKIRGPLNATGRAPLIIFFAMSPSGKSLSVSSTKFGLS